MLQKNILEVKLNPILKKAAFNAILSTFEDNLRSEEAMNAALSIAQGFANEFANTAAPELADVIDEYIKMADVDLTRCIIPQNFIVAGTSPSGPVTGTATGLLSGVVIGGVK